MAAKRPSPEEWHNAISICRSPPEVLDALQNIVDQHKVSLSIEPDSESRELILPAMGHIPLGIVQEFAYYYLCSVLSKD